MTQVRGSASMDVDSDTSSQAIINFLSVLPRGKVSIHTTQGDRYWDSSWSTLTVDWVYDLEDESAIDG